jgi:hypothetical protein
MGGLRVGMQDDLLDQTPQEIGSFGPGAVFVQCLRQMGNLPGVDPCKAGMKRNWLRLRVRKEGSFKAGAFCLHAQRFADGPQLRGC